MPAASIVRRRPGAPSSARNAWRHTDPVDSESSRPFRTNERISPCCWMSRVAPDGMKRDSPIPAGYIGRLVRIKNREWRMSPLPPGGDAGTQLTLEPGAASFSGESRITWSPEVAASTIPWLSTPRSIAGARFATRITLFPTSVSGAYHCLIPDTTCRVSPPPTSTLRTSSLLAFVWAVASTTFPTLRTTFLKSSMVMVDGAAGGGGTGAAGTGPTMGSSSRRSDFRQGLRQVFDDIGDVFDARGDSDEAVADTDRRPLRGAQVRMRAPGGIRAGGRHVAQAGHQLDQAAGADEAVRRADPAAEVEGQHRPQQRLQIPVGLRIVQPQDLPMPREDLRENRGVPGRALHPKSERFHPPQRQPGVQGGNGAAGEDVPLPHRVDERGRARDESARRVAVPVQEFRPAVEDHVRAPLDRAAEDGRGEG